MKGKCLCVLVGIVVVILGYSFTKDGGAAYATSYAKHIAVSAHTSGEISRESTIQVRFTDDIVSLDTVNQPLGKSPLEFEPEIPGVALWIDRRTLEFRPGRELPAGQSYKASVYLSEFMRTDKISEVYLFEFTTLRQAFEITVDGLQAVSQNDLKSLQLTGKVVTADVQDRRDIVNFLSAEQEGRRLPIQWTHSENKREHAFVVSGIVRGRKRSNVFLQWDGSAIEVKKTGKQTITVPQLKEFKVLRIRSVDEAEQYVEIRFSETLQEDQNLNGLIRIEEQQELRFTINRNIVQVYSSQRWPDRVRVSVEPGIRNVLGYRLEKKETTEVNFGGLKPQARFVGKGVILPTTQGLTIPIETINLTSIIVEAMQVYEDNIPQFLQVNTLEGDQELRRVGRVVWKKVIDLDSTPDKKDKWVRSGLDVTPLVENNPGGLYRIEVSFRRPHIVYSCKDPKGGRQEEELEMSLENLDEEDQSSYWDLWEDYYEGFDDYEDYYDYYENRWNPCHPAYYRRYYDHNITVARNVLVSDIGLIAKRGSDDQVFVVATDLKTAQPLPGVELTLMDYQQQVHSMGKTDREGMALLCSEEEPFLLRAKYKNQIGYLRLDDGSALSISHFDVSGQTIKKGLKGFIYGERGVWRPGDPIYLTFILWDSDNMLPKTHPVIFELRNPKGQLVKVIKKKESLHGFYPFQTATAPDAPTGNWIARVRVGGAIFEKVLKIETVMPNRLKIGLDFGAETKSLSGGTVTGELSARWLHGAIARNLKADVKLAFTASKTTFAKYTEYVFDDPVRQYEPEEQDIFAGPLDEHGRATIMADIFAQNVSPGMLTAHFKTRVFEAGGAFSVDRFSIPYHPYPRYVGIRIPEGDQRGMLLTDTLHTVRIVMLDAQGDPVPKGRVEIQLYKIDWRWWWEKGAESLNYINSSSYKPLQTDVIEIENGRGKWQFEIKYPSWGRYLIRAHDLDGNHYAGQILYIDWPGWAGRAKKDIPGGATVLSFSSDKETYTVGENIVLTIPTGPQGRGLVSIESSSKILQAGWIEATGEEMTRYAFLATEEMAPTVYAHVTFLQPHLQTENDLPIRMYGVIRINVEDPATRLNPYIETPEIFVPEETAEIVISETNGKPMTYTIAIVDEGLLDLTRFETPDPRSHFYQTEALGVQTWDLFDMVAGAYGGVLEKLLAIGGGDKGLRTGEQKANRFPPMVRFLGPFELEAGKANTHTIDIPQYVGSVRVMVVAGQSGAFGSAEKAVFVRKSLMILGTLPRVLGPEEEVALPITVFVMDETMKEVSVTVSTEGPLSVAGPSEKRIVFSEPGDDVITFELKATSQTGIASVSIQASSGDVKARQKIELDVRMPAVGSVTDVVETVLQKNGIWRQEVTFPGIAGTNEVSLEVSHIPPIDLTKRIRYLIRYPHGCVEQMTSSVFPQLYVDKFVELYPEEQDKIQRNIEVALERLQSFQKADGGFVYWPGQSKADDWSSSYAGHFLVEAEKAGYILPPGLLEHWKDYQRRMAQLWEPGSERSELIQAYRLYTLALAGDAELSAMNRLREDPDLPTAARWRLAAAYLLAGQPEAAEELVEDADASIPEYQELSNTYGSDLRDTAMVLESLCFMNQLEMAGPLVKAISEKLSSGRWYSTQTTAYALIAMAQYVSLTSDEEVSGKIQCTFSWNNAEEQLITSDYPLVQQSLIAGDNPTGIIELKNTGDALLYPRIIMTGTPLPGEEKAAENGLRMKVRYVTLAGLQLYPQELEQGTDFIAEVIITNTGHKGTYKEIALSHLFPSGWEIHNERMDPAEQQQGDYTYQDIRDDRIYTYFDIRQNESKTFRTLLNASYLGKFYLPMVAAEAMYDATINARVPGQWVMVVVPGAGE